MQINPTAKSVSLASLALEAVGNDNSGPSALIVLLSKSQGYFGEEYGKAVAMNNPVSQVLLNRLNYFAGMSQSCLHCHTKCMEMAKGWEVII